MTPGDTPEPVLVPDFDNNTIWDHFRGFAAEPERAGDRAMYLPEALENELLDAGDCEAVRQQVQSVLHANSSILKKLMPYHSKLVKKITKYDWKMFRHLRRLGGY